MINILYYGFVEVDLRVGGRFYLSTAVLNLKTHIEINHPDLAKELNWIVIQEVIDNNKLIKLCIDKNIDILATSHYIWNNIRIMSQLEAVKKFLPLKTKIVAGGPSISANIDPDFFTKFPFIDYAIYGPGELAFSDIVSSIFNKTKLIAFNTSNLAWFDKDKQKTVVAAYKYVPISSVSSYVYNKELFRQLVKEVQEKGHRVAIPFELTRGCPYACTFCDWNSGLSNKVSRRKKSYEEEIDLFQELDVKIIYLADANVGQYDEDVDMIAYFAKKNIEENAKFQVEGNLSKLRKENNLKIFHLLAKAKLINATGLIIAVQDINEEILKNTDRPDVTWDEHKKIINELLYHYPNYFAKLQLIQGLPGQTLQSWKETLDEVTKERVLLLNFINEYLPTSPAAIDKEYQQKWHYKYSQSLRVHGRKVNDNKIFRGNIPKSSTTFSQKDFTEMTVLSQLYAQVQMIKCCFPDWENFDTKSIVESYMLTPSYKKYVEVLYDNWVNHDKFFWSSWQLGLHMEQPEIYYSACDNPNNMFIISSDFWTWLIKKPELRHLTKRLYKLFQATIKSGNEEIYADDSWDSIDKAGLHFLIRDYY